MKKEMIVFLLAGLLIALLAVFYAVYEADTDEVSDSDTDTAGEPAETGEHGHEAVAEIADSHGSEHDAEIAAANDAPSVDDHSAGETGHDAAAEDTHAAEDTGHDTTTSDTHAEADAHDTTAEDTHADAADHDTHDTTAEDTHAAEDTGHDTTASDTHADAAAHDATAGDAHAEEEAGHDTTASDTHAGTAAHDATAGDAHAEEEAGHGHGTPQIGYMGLADKEPIDEHELDHFVERVQEEAYEKGEQDQIRFGLFGIFFALTYLAFAKIKTGNISQRLKNAIDWHTLGTVTGIILIFLVIPSGIIITFFYMPTSTEVYSSVEDMTNQPVLAFFRNLHNWSSEIFILLSLLHAARTVSTRTFLGKRKLIWLLGALALVVGWVAFLSGTFMRGDQEALEGFEHMMYSFTLVPLGQPIVDFFSGEYTLMKLTALHIGVTMFIIALTLVLHVLMRKVHVLVTMRWKKAVAYTVALTLFMVVQSVVMEAPFIRGPESGPTISGIEATKPPWPIYFLIQGENWFGADAMVAILIVAFVPLIIFPYVVEFLPLAAAKKARVGEALFYLGVFAMIGVSYIAAAGEIQAHIF